MPKIVLDVHQQLPRYWHNDRRPGFRIFGADLDQPTFPYLSQMAIDRELREVLPPDRN
jgi:hypothetical protein